MVAKVRISSGSTWERVVGYSRALRVGPWVFVAGTTATDPDGKVLAEGDPAGQTRIILEKIGTALRQAGAALEDVVRTVMYVTDIDDWEAIGRVHGELLGNAAPVATMVQVQRLVDPRMLVEIEAMAYRDERHGD